MQNKTTFYVTFSLCIFFILFTFLLGRLGVLGWMTNGMQWVFSPLERLAFATYQKIIPQDETQSALKKENLKLRTQLLHENEIQQDNKALRDQFALSNPAPATLLPSHIIAAPNFFPAITYPESFILDKGESDGVVVGNAVVYQDNALGLIANVTKHTAFVSLISNTKTIAPAMDNATSAFGVVKGKGNGDIALENVLLSDTIKKGDTVVTNLSANTNGSGYPPGLIVGKIISVEKNPSALFQTANVKSLVDFEKLGMVFIVLK